jgi:hypothetical protein
VAALGHPPEGPGRLPDVPHGQRERLQDARREQVKQVGQHPADPDGSGLDQVEGAVGHPRVRRTYVLSGPDVGLAHLKEPSSSR